MLSNIPFILFESGFVLNGRIADACKRLGFAPKIAARASQVDFVVELVAANVGVAILPEMIAERFSQGGVTVVADLSAPVVGLLETIRFMGPVTVKNLVYVRSPRPV
jgi:DNA-binding transcriptional LysR family regulator